MNKPHPKKEINDDEVLCQRCFQLRHYHKLTETSLTKDDYLNIMKENFEVLKQLGE